jgi:hypothetical protein
MTRHFDVVGFAFSSQSSFLVVIIRGYRPGGHAPSPSTRHAVTPDRRYLGAAGARRS